MNLKAKYSNPKILIIDHGCSAHDAYKTKITIHGCNIERANYQNLSDIPHNPTSQHLTHTIKALEQHQQLPAEPAAKFGSRQWSSHNDEIHWSGGAYNNLVVRSFIQDIAERKKTESRMYYLANFDSLTKLPNREQFKQYVAHKLEEARRYQQKLALLFLDLDYFKQINDTYGHSVGDGLLESVAKRISECCRQSDFVIQDGAYKKNVMAARIGGDEFIILLSNITRPLDVARVAKRILTALKTPISINNKLIQTSASIGISTFPNDGSSIEALVQNADTAMYHVKANGRDNYQFFSTAMHTKAFEKLSLETSLRRALDNREIFLNYQPRFNLEDNQLIGVEALIRWRHTERGIIMPKEFINIAEETGVILEIGDWVFTETCRQIQNWLVSGLKPKKVAINLSAIEFKDPLLINRIERAIQQFKIPKNLIEIEITESTLMSDLDRSAKVLQQLKNLGITISIDNFGTGFSSLQYLMQLPLDQLKIDKLFISQIANDDSIKTLTKAIIDMSHSLKFKVSAEGVESEQQLKILKQFHCDEAQGFLLSHPLHSLDLAKRFKPRK